MSRRWYGSLYWRIALGLFAFLALMLAAEGAIFLWMTERIAGSMQRATYHDLTGLLHEVFNETTRADVFELLRQALASYRTAG